MSKSCPVPLAHVPTTETSVIRHVLVVDDSRFQRRTLATMLKRSGYQVVEAASGEEALALAGRKRFDLVISDWMMPGLTGPELCSALRAKPGGAFLYIVLLTSKSEKNEVARGLDSGADDFLIKPVTSTELDARIRSAGRIVAMQRALQSKNDELQGALEEIRTLYDATERDLREARALQASLLRPRDALIGPARVSLTVQAAGHVGGDLVGAFPINDQQLGLFALDVSGHGISAALMTARLAGVLSGSLPGQNLAIDYGPDGRPRARDPARVAQDLNALLLDEIETDHFATLILGNLMLDTGRLDLVQAGHPYAMVQTGRGAVRTFGSPGMPIGLLPGAFHQTVSTWLSPGDRLVMVSDGVTEAQDSRGRMFEDTGLIAALKRTRDVPTENLGPAILSELERHTGSNAFEDDVSLLVLDFGGPSDRA